MKTLTYLLSLFILISCSKPEIKIEERARFQTVVQEKLMGPLAKAPQKFRFDFKTDTLLRGEAGTLISIPEGAFINKKGEVIKGQIELELIEAYELKDFFSNDLQTRSGDRILQSAGMIYLDASANGETLTLKEGMSLDVEIPYSNQEAGYRMFWGARDENGDIDWELEEGSQEELIPLPLDTFNLKLFKTFRFNRSKNLFSWEDSLILNDPKYENTFIATEAFEERFWLLRDQLHLYGWYYLEHYESSYWRNWNKIYTFYEYKFQDGDTLLIRDVSLLEIYLANIDKELSKVDSMVLPLFKEREEKWNTYLKDSLNFHTDWMYWAEEYVDNILKMNLGKVPIYDPRGVDMEAENARDLLIETGYTPREAYDQQRIHRRRANMLQNRALRRNLEGMSDSLMQEYEKQLTRAFKIDRLGWANCDRFYNDPNAKAVELYVKLDQDSIMNKRIILIFPEENIAIAPVSVDERGYYFSSSPDKQINLPIGKKAALIAMAKSANEPLFAMESFEIKEHQSFSLELKGTSYEIIEERLSALK